MGKQAKKIDLKQLYRLVYERGSATKPELAQLSNISLTAISDYINQLESLGMLVTVKKGTSSGGRKPQVYQLNGTFRYIVGIDLRASHFYVFVSDLTGNVISSRVVSITSHDYQDYLNTLESVINSVLLNLSLSNSAIVAIGVSVSGVTDSSNQVIDRSNELEWVNRSLALDLEQRIGIPVFAETEVRIYARNEIEFGEPNNVATVLHVSRGIGLALVINNQIFQGFTNRSGDNRFFGSEVDQLYHVIRTDEVITEINSQPYYHKLMKQEEIGELNSRFYERLSDPDVRRRIDDFTLRIAKFMTALTHILNPKKVLLTGNVFDYNDFIFSQVRDHMLRDHSVYFMPVIKRNATETGPLERGIVKFVMEKFFSLQQFKVTREGKVDYCS